MTFSQHTATSVVPLLARIVLCLAFVPSGWNKIMDTRTFEGAQAQRLIELGVVDRVQTSARPVEPAAFIQGTANEELQSDPEPNRPQRDPDPDDDELEEDLEDAQEQVEQGLEEAGEVLEELADPPEDTLHEGALGSEVVEAKKLHGITLMLDRYGFTEIAPWLPVTLAWVLALTELIGGALLLPGLLSRVWGLGLAIAMGVAFYLVTIQINGLFTMNYFAFQEAQNHAYFNTMFSQLGLFVLAFGVFLAGPGAISIDRALFGRSHHHHDSEFD